MPVTVGEIMWELDRQRNPVCYRWMMIRLFRSLFKSSKSRKHTTPLFFLHWPQWMRCWQVVRTVRQNKRQSILTSLPVYRYHKWSNSWQSFYYKRHTPAEHPATISVFIQNIKRPDSGRNAATHHKVLSRSIQLLWTYIFAYMQINTHFTSNRTALHGKTSTFGPRIRTAPRHFSYSHKKQHNILEYVRFYAKYCSRNWYVNAVKQKNECTSHG